MYSQTPASLSLKTPVIQPAIAIGAVPNHLNTAGDFPSIFFKNKKGMF